MLESGLDQQIYIAGDSVTCNDPGCPCDGEVIPLARRVTPREVGFAVHRHQVRHRPSSPDQEA